MKIDLHMHTINSDGTDSTSELLQKLAELEVDIASITDHESVGAYFDLKNIKNKLGRSLNLIKGVELSFLHDGYVRDILAYGFDIEKINAFLQERHSREIQMKTQKSVLNRFKKLLREKELKFDENIEVKIGKKAEAFGLLWTSVASYEENIQKYPFLIHNTDFYWNYFINPKSEFFVGEVDDTYPNMHEIIDAIHDAGGLAFLAHPFFYDHRPATVVSLVDTAIIYGIDGLECFHCANTGDETAFLLAVAADKNLLVCGGSDYHGKYKANVNLLTGCGNRLIDFENMKPWYDKVEKIELE